MTAAALLLTAPEGPHSVAPDTKLLGLPLVRRTVLAAQKAGFSRIVASDSAAAEALERALTGTGAKLLAAGAPVPEDAVSVPWNRGLRPAEVRRLAAGESLDGLGVAVVTPSDLKRAETWLLRGCVKENEGFLSRHFERPISLAVSRYLAATRVTPTAMTLISFAIGLLGSVFFLSARPLWQTAGGCLFLLHSILDGCDGELARLKFQESHRGGVLDFWCDNIVHTAVFAALATGWSLSLRAAWPLWLGASTVAGTLASAALAYRLTMRRPREGPLFTGVTAPETPETAASRLANTLARRDFIYIVLALSLFGKANWFLVPTSVGAPAYFFLVAALARRRPERIVT